MNNPFSNNNNNKTKPAFGTRIFATSNRTWKDENFKPGTQGAYCTSFDDFSNEPSENLGHFGQFTGEIDEQQPVSDYKLFFAQKLRPFLTPQQLQWVLGILGIKLARVVHPESVGGKEAFIRAEREQMKEIGGERILLLVPGFALGAQYQMMKAAAVARSVSIRNMLVQVFAWPSHGMRSLSAYFADTENCIASVDSGEESIELAIEAAGGARFVDLVGHSLGCLLLCMVVLCRYNKMKVAGKTTRLLTWMKCLSQSANMEVLRGFPNLLSEGADMDKELEKFNSIYLFEPDVGLIPYVNTFAKALCASAKRVYVIGSHKDLALLFSQELRQLWVDADHHRLGQINQARKAGDTIFIDAAKIDLSPFDGHSARTELISYLDANPDIIFDKALFETTYVNDATVYVLLVSLEELGSAVQGKSAR